MEVSKIPDMMENNPPKQFTKKLIPELVDIKIKTHHLSLRLFQHTFGTHPEQPFTNRQKSRDSFHHWRTPGGLRTGGAVQPMRLVCFQASRLWFDTPILCTFPAFRLGLPKSNP